LLGGIEMKFSEIWRASKLLVQSALVGLVFAIVGAFAALSFCMLIVKLHFEPAFLGYVLFVAGVYGFRAALKKFQTDELMTHRVQFLGASIALVTLTLAGLFTLYQALFDVWMTAYPFANTSLWRQRLYFRLATLFVIGMLAGGLAAWMFRHRRKP